MKLSAFVTCFVAFVVTAECCPLAKRHGGYVSVAESAIAAQTTDEEAERIMNNLVEIQASYPRCPYPNGLFPVPYDCSRFVSCANGIAQEMICSPGTVFSPRLRVCVWPNPEDCPVLFK